MIPNTSDTPRLTRLTAFLGTKRFFAIIVGVFAFQASWIALTTRYPQAFDEQFHFGVIKLYAHHLSPFWSGQPDGVEQLGAITRDPSYLYQYLLSFPYRLISIFTSSEATQVVLLRLMNVAILASALVVIRKFLCQVGASAAMRNVVLAFFVLTPVVPLLGGQINYDSLMILMTALSFTVYLDFRQKLRINKLWSWDKLTRLVIVCLLACMVKYAFLPLAAGLAFAVIFDWRFARKNTLAILPDKTTLKLTKRVVLYGIALILALCLFSERYAVNVVRYHTPTPECDQVLSAAECQTYAPWARNYMFDSWDIHPTHAQLLGYPGKWIGQAHSETVFTITSRFNASGTVDYYGVKQLIIPNVLSWTVLVGGFVLCARYWRYLWARSELRILLGLTALYVLALFSQNLLDYLHLGVPVAIHGRYLLPILPIWYLVIGLATAKFIHAIAKKRTTAVRSKTMLATVVLVVLLVEGGGFVTLIIRSHADWFWPQSRPAQQANQYVQDVLKYVVLNP